MNIIPCLNFEEQLHYWLLKEESIEALIDKSMNLAGYSKCERIYIGSSFCGRYFIMQQEEQYTSLLEVCMQRDIKVTLAIPTFTEKDLNKGKEKIESFSPYFNEVIDEITVNDYGMLDYIAGSYKPMGINLGRLFMKDYRELRYPDYFNLTLRPKIFTQYLEKLLQQYPICNLEFDPTHQAIDFSERPGGVGIGLHSPYCYMTMGQICEYASINKEIHKKFRPNPNCQRECNEGRINYFFEDGHNWMRIGKAIFFDNRAPELIGIDWVRLIYFPADLEVNS